MYLMADFIFEQRGKNMPYNEKIDARITKIVSRMMHAAT
jgi:hypothetical protein